MRRWTRFWDRREPPTALALARLLVGAVLLVDFAQIIGYGLVDVIFAAPPAGLAVGKPLVAHWWGAAAGGRTFAVAFAALALFTAGAFTRLAGLTFALASGQLSMLCPDADRGIDALLRVVVAVLALSGSHARWSLDALVRRALGRPFPALVPAWPRYLLYLQVVWLYFSAAHTKADPSWGPLGGFSALGYVLSDPHYARFAPGWVSSVYPLTQLGTAATIVFEWGAPLLLLFHWWHVTPERPGRLRRWSNRFRLRFVYIATGAAFHLAIAATLRLGIFPFGVLALYPLLFHPDELRAAARRLRLARDPTPVAASDPAWGRDSSSSA